MVLDFRADHFRQDHLSYNNKATYCSWTNQKGTRRRYNQPLYWMNVHWGNSAKDLTEHKPANQPNTLSLRTLLCFEVRQALDYDIGSGNDAHY